MGRVAPRAAVAVALVASLVVVVVGAPSPPVAADEPAYALLIGDSVLEALEPASMQAARDVIGSEHSFVLDAMGCRRLNSPGCRFDHIPVPNTALEAMREHAGRFTGALVMVAGYNDLLATPEKFASDVDVILTEARAQGVPHVLWLTYREGGEYDAAYRRHNQILRDKAAVWPELRVVDWSERSASMPRAWFSSDNYHLSRHSAYGMAVLIAQALAELDADGGVDAVDATAIPTATQPPPRIGHVSPVRCYGNTWVGYDRPTSGPPQVIGPSGGLNLLDRPVRLVDTRTGPGKVGPHRVLPVQVTGVAGVPENAPGALVTVTTIEPCAAGFVTLFPCGTAVPPTATLNADREATVANSAVVPLGGGTLCVYVNEPTDIVVDLTGWIGAGGVGTEIVAPSRLVDTRAGHGQALSAPQRRLVGGHGLTVDVSAHPDTTDAHAVSVNVTAVAPAAAGYVSLLPGECPAPGSPPSTATLTMPGGRDVAAAATVGTPGGRFCVYANVDTDVVVDLQAVHRDTNVVAPVFPARLHDTRTAGPVPPTGLDVDLLVGVVPADSKAVVLNVVAVDPASAGWLVVHPCASPRPFVSQLNYTRATTVANRAIVSLDAGRDLCVSSSTPVHVVIDVQAWIL